MKISTTALRWFLTVAVLLLTSLQSIHMPTSPAPVFLAPAVSSDFGQLSIKEAKLQLFGQEKPLTTSLGKQDKSATFSKMSASPEIEQSFGKLPLSFIPNLGQADPAVHFQMKGTGGTISFASGEVGFLLPSMNPISSAQSVPAGSSEKDAVGSSTMRMHFEDANPSPEMAGAEMQSGVVNYFIGNDPVKWHTSIPTYGQVAYKGIYPGIDLVFYGNQQELEYDFVVAAGADPNAISLSFEGADKIEIDAEGDLVLQANGRQIRQRKPLIYQEEDAVRKQIAGGYVLQNNRVHFQVGEYESSRPITIDPVLVYSNRPGVGGDSWRIALDSARNAYIVGSTDNNNPVTPDAVQPTYGGNSDAFLLKLNASGTQVLYATYFGGSGDDRAYGLALDSSGNAYVTGNTTSTDFPVMNAMQPAYAGGDTDVFVVKLNSTGSALVYSTYFGGDYGDSARTIAADGAGNAYIAGGTNSPELATVQLGVPIRVGYATGYIAKLNAAGSAVVYSTSFGGNVHTGCLAIAVDSAGSAYVTGRTDAYAPGSFPVVNALQPDIGGGADAFVGKLKPDGSAFDFLTFLGGSGADIGGDIALDSLGNIYVTGYTNSTNFPTANPLQAANAGGFDAFITKINNTGTAWIYSTYLGGSANEAHAFSLSGIAVDAFGSAYVTGYTESVDFPTVNAFQPAFAGGALDAYVTKLNAYGSALVYSTYLGGTGLDYGNAIAVDSSGNAYVTGDTSFAGGFPTTNPNPPYGIAFITKLGIADAGPNRYISSENQAATTIQGTVASDSPNLTYRWLEGQTQLSAWQSVVSGTAYLALNGVPHLSLGDHTLTLEVNDGQFSASDNMILTVNNSSPHPAPMGAGTYEYNAPVILGGQIADFDGDTVSYQWMEGTTILFTGQIQATSGGSPVTLPDYVLSDLSIGIHTLALQANDGVNAPVSSSILVEINDAAPPKLSPVPNKTILWPPNHSMVNIIIQANAYDEGGSPVTLSASVSSNEPQGPDGDWTQPVINQDTITLQLRADRSGSGDGRQYTISITATDITNNSSTADVQIIVPHDQRKK